MLENKWNWTKCHNFCYPTLFSFESHSYCFYEPTSKSCFFQAFWAELFSSFPQKRKWNVFHPISQIKSIRHFLWLRWFPCSITNIVQNPNTPQHFRSTTDLELTFFIEFFLLFSLGNQKYIFVDSGCFVIFALFIGIFSFETGSSSLIERLNEIFCLWFSH